MYRRDTCDSKLSSSTCVCVGEYFEVGSHNTRFLQFTELFVAIKIIITHTKMDIVKRVLEEEQREAEKYKSIEVKKHLEAKVDLGYLMCSDPNDLDEKRLKYDINHLVCGALFAYKIFVSFAGKRRNSIWPV